MGGEGDRDGVRRYLVERAAVEEGESSAWEGPREHETEGCAYTHTEIET